jgi:electron transfer flavoprotein alpha subunit
MVYGGSAFRVEQCLSTPGFFLVSDGACAEPCEPSGKEAPIVSAELVQDDGRVRFVERKPRSVESVNLTVAKRVISVGRGLEKQEDLGLIQNLANALEAEVGCSRPIAEGNNWLARERYIGVSGVMLSPDIFMTVGVSGQVQHMVGATSSKTIFAINKDKNAPVFKHADYGIVGDLYDVVPQIIEKLQA